MSRPAQRPDHALEIDRKVSATSGRRAIAALMLEEGAAAP